MTNISTHAPESPGIHGPDAPPFAFDNSYARLPERLKALRPLKIVSPQSSPRADYPLPYAEARRRPRHSPPLADFA
jgi:hypothetical protein